MTGEKLSRKSKSVLSKEDMVECIEEFSRGMKEFAEEFSRAAEAAPLLDGDVVEKLYDIAREMKSKLDQLRDKYPA